MASNPVSHHPGAAPPRPGWRLALLVVLVLLALVNGLVLVLHLRRQQPIPALPPAAPASKPQTRGPVPPGFDIVRVDAAGNAVLAGRAMPGATVTVKDGNAVLGAAKADARGAFVLLPSKPLPPGQHEITLSETLPDGNIIEGEQSASINLPGHGGQALAVISGPGGSAVVSGQGPQPGELGMGAVDYDATGQAIFSGTSPAGARVTVTQGGKTLGIAQADANGHWHLQAPVPAGPGMITLKATTGSGAALPEVSVPFAPEMLSPALGEGQVVIVPGDNLWTIARRVYGHGVRYSLIYSANAGQIRDPDLIFPGQKFSLPPQQAR